MLRTIICTAMLFAMYFNSLNAQDPYTQKIDSLEEVIRSLEKIDQLEKKIQSLEKVDKTEKKINMLTHPEVKELNIQNLTQEIKRAKGGLTAGLIMSLAGGLMLLGGSSHGSEDEILKTFLNFNGGFLSLPGVLLTISNGAKLASLKKVHLGEVGIKTGNSGLGLYLSI